MVHGPEMLDISQLIALIAQIEVPLAQVIVQSCGGMAGLATVRAQELIQIEGIGQAKALAIVAAVQLGRRLQDWQLWRSKRVTVQRPSQAADLVLHRLSNLVQEELVTMLLDIHNGVMDVVTVYIGSLDTTAVRITEVFRQAIIQNAARLIVAHNHPTGDLTPSPQDVVLTKALIEAGNNLDIPVVDHLIIAGGQWLSMREAGLGFSPDSP
jgi:DNA repair protein RadC